MRDALHAARARSVEALRYFPLTPAQTASALRQCASDLDWLDACLDILVAEV